MSIDRKTRWLSTPAHASHWPAPIRLLRVWGRVWAYLVAAMFLLMPLLTAFSLLLSGSGAGTSLGPWHSSFGYSHWRFALAAALLAGGVAASLAFLLGRNGIRLLALYALVAFLAQQFLDPYDAMRAQRLSQRPGAVSVTTQGSHGATSVVMNALLVGSIFLAWLHMAIAPDPTPSDRVCRSCGYDLTGLPADAEHCPECGKSRWPPMKVSKRALSRR